MSDATTASSFAFAELPMTKSQVVEQIRTFNVSAPREWLESFDFSALQGYLARLLKLGESVAVAATAYWTWAEAAQASSALPPDPQRSC